MFRFVGIDPGQKGAIAVLPDETFLEFSKNTEHDAYAWLAMYASTSDDLVAVLERVGPARAGVNSAQGLANASFKFGEHYGMLRGFLIAASVRHKLITPAMWQRTVGLPTRGKSETATQWKNRKKQAAQRLFPKIRMTHDIVDAFLIADVCRQKYALDMAQAAGT